MPSRISILSDSRGSLTKHFTLDENDILIKTSPDHIVSGTIDTVEVDSSGLVELIKSLNQSQCLCLGALQDYSKQSTIKCQAMASDGSPTRAKKFLDYRGGNSWCLFDIDNSGKSPLEMIDLLSTIDPQIKTASLVVSPSSSSYLYKSDGSAIVEEGNYHIFVECEGNSVEYANLIFNRLILAGYGRAFVTSAGTITIKTVIDKAVNSFEREIYVASPVVSDNLISKRAEYLQYQEGHVVDVAKLPVMSKEEELELRQLYIDLRQTVATEAEEKRSEYNEKRAKDRARVNGTSKLYELAGISDQVTTYSKAGIPIVELLSNDIIYNNEGEQFFVRDLLIDPVEEPLKLPDVEDPWVRGNKELNQVGKGVATALPGFKIYSHNHAGLLYLIRWDIQDLIQVLQSDSYSINAKKLIYRLISTNQQQLASKATDSELSELATTFKKVLGNIPGSGVSTEKADIKRRLNPAKDPDDAEDTLELRLNSQYGVGQLGNKAVILQEKWNEEIEAFVTVCNKPFDLDLLHKNEQVRVPGVQGTKSSFSAWLEQPGRNTYDSVIFKPVPGMIRKPVQPRIIQQGGDYNLYQGLMFDPDKAIYPTKILKHLKEIWCGGSEAEYKYLCGWLASLFQKPNEVNGTAIVLQSTPGAGKNIIIDNCIVKPFGIHGLSTTRREDFVGRFNSQLGVNVFLFANESTFPGNHEDKSHIKALITDPTRTIELKGIDGMKCRNYSSMMFASNNSWVMNLDTGDRRICYLSVSDAMAGEAWYFKELIEEINNGGADGMVKHFLDYNIYDFDITDIPTGNSAQRKADLMKSVHNTIRFFMILLDEQGSLEVFRTHEHIKSLNAWHQGEGELIMTRESFYNLYWTHMEYYKGGRAFDDVMVMQREMETAGYLSPPNTKNPEKYAVVNCINKGKYSWRFKEISECRKLVFGE